MDNRKLIIGLYVIFIIVFIASWIIIAPRMESLVESAQVSSAPSVETSAVELFIHNEWSGIVTYFGSVFFAIPAVVMVFYNGFNIAAMGPLFAKIIPNGAIMYMLYLIPHGIFEITGMILQSAAGILLFLFVWRFIKAWRSSDTDGASDAFGMTKKVLIQSVVLMVIATVLTLVAAPIESYVSIPFSQVIMGIFGLM
ncbi:MAG: hypothetical protein BZ138_06635 [Methanosphaera sp. rholeuAM270]|nr:MAG: hypothetical protein BZ138_06635 [Methanosphaera sp. rholeuAM270]